MNNSRTPERHPVRKIAGFLVGNWPARIYLVVVAASIAFAVIATVVDSNPDASFAGVWPFFATMPWSLLLIGLVPDSEGLAAQSVLVGILAVGTLANLATIGWLVNLVRGPSAAPAR